MYQIIADVFSEYIISLVSIYIIATLYIEFSYQINTKSTLLVCFWSSHIQLIGIPSVKYVELWYGTAKSTRLREASD